MYETTVFKVKYDPVKTIKLYFMEKYYSFKI